MPERGDEFYVGYRERAPAGVAARTRLMVGAVLCVGVVLAVVLVLAQAPFDEGVFEYGVEREFRGLLIERPYPLLLVPQQGAALPSERFVSHYLVARGKHGAAEWVAGLDGRPVRLTGSRIFNERQRMIEVHALERIDERTEPELAALDPHGELALGRMSLSGEIVDSKCNLGVMKPGRGKPHQACAIRCISGGIPPVLRIRDAAGRLDYLLLVGPRGEPVNREVLDFVAEPVEISGEVARRGDLLVLYADPSTYRVLGP